MFNSFFYRYCCKLGNKNFTLKEQFNLYNNNFGFPNDESLAFKLQQFVYKIQYQVRNFKDFFKIIGLKYHGIQQLGKWVLQCMKQSSKRQYHKPYVYFSNIKKNMGYENYNNFKIRWNIIEENKKQWLKQQIIQQKQENEKYRKEKEERILFKMEQQRQKREEQKKAQLLQKQQNLITNNSDKNNKKRKRKNKRKTKRNNNNSPNTNDNGIKILFCWSMIGRYGGSKDNVTELKYNYSYPFVRVYIEIVNGKNEIYSLDEMYFDGYNDNGITFTDTCYPDKYIDGNISIPIKMCHKTSKFFSDFSMLSLGKRFGNENIIRARIRGTRNDGTIFEYCQPNDWIEQMTQRQVELDLERLEKEKQLAKHKKILEKREKQRLEQIEKNKLEKIARKQRKELEKQERQAKEQKIKEEKRKKAMQTTMDHLFDKIAICSRIVGSQQEQQQRYCPWFQFSFATIDNNGNITYNVKEIDLDSCSIVRVMFKIVSSKVKSFDCICFDGDSPSVHHRHSITYPDIFVHGKESKVLIKGPIDKNTRLIFYGDFSLKNLCNTFGENLERGIRPRIKGVTMNGCTFSCSAGNIYNIFGKRNFIDSAPATTSPAGLGCPVAPPNDEMEQMQQVEHTVDQMVEQQVECEQVEQQVEIQEEKQMEFEQESSNVAIENEMIQESHEQIPQSREYDSNGMTMSHDESQNRLFNVPQTQTQTQIQIQQIPVVFLPVNQNLQSVPIVQAVQYVSVPQTMIQMNQTNSDGYYQHNHYQQYQQYQQVQYQQQQHQQQQYEYQEISTQVTSIEENQEEFETVNKMHPVAEPHAMYNGAKPRRPPIAMFHNRNINENNGNTNVNMNENDSIDNSMVSTFGNLTNGHCNDWDTNSQSIQSDKQSMLYNDNNVEYYDGFNNYSNNNKNTNNSNNGKNHKRHHRSKRKHQK